MHFFLSPRTREDGKRISTILYKGKGRIWKKKIFGGGKFDGKVVFNFERRGVHGF